MAIPQVDQLVNWVAAEMSTPPDLIKIAFCLILNFPLSAIVKRIPQTKQGIKEMFCLVMGIFYLVGIFSLWNGMFHLMVASTVTYWLAYTFKGSVLMPWANFVLVIGHLMWTHIQEQMGDSNEFVSTIGISGSHMVLVIKLTSFAWDVYDGTRPVKSLTDHQQRSSVTTYPSFLRFMAWCFFFPAVLTGPSCSFRDFSDWIDLSMFKELAQMKPNYATDGPEPPTDTGMLKIPRSGHVALLKVLEGAVWTFLFFQSSNYVSPDYLFTEGYQRMPFILRILYLWGLAFAYQLKFFVAWTFSDAACIHCGLGFNGVHNGRLKWDRVTNVHPVAIGTAQNAHTYINNWNINTSKWLRNYVYLRITPKGQKPGAQSVILTFLFSALWHGTRSGYYLTLLAVAFYQVFGKMYRKRLRPVFVGTTFKIAYDVVSLAATQLAFAFAAQPFVLLNITPSIFVWASVYFYVLVALVVSWITLAGPLAGVTTGALRRLRKDIDTID